MADSKPLLLEIGVEELPSSFVDGALAALPDLVTTKLAALRLTHGAVRVLGTPRRLAVHVTAVATGQADLDEEVLGPPETAAFKDGAPTRAAEAFATKLGVPVSALRVEAREASGKTKAGRYVVGRRQEKGRPALELLGPALGEVCAAIPFRKSMRWGAGEATFGRPVQWLVALLGETVIPVTFAGCASGRTTRGHRFLAPKPFDVTGPDSYEAQLQQAHVFVDRQARARVMMERVAAAAKVAGGTFDPDPYLVDENASLVEEPHVITGGFEEAFLALPAFVIRAVARGHQKYFCVAQGDGRAPDKLLPHYLAVVNTANDPKKIALGNDRVMRARLSDARFFDGEDRKVPLGKRAEKLKGIVFHHRLGTVADKVARLRPLAAAIAKTLGLSAEVTADIDAAVTVAKADLVSLMVGEFPELQGDAGRTYALHEGLRPAVADAIRDHYRPLGAEGPVAPSDVSAVVALADRLDSLVGCFAIGLSPTGAADPFALRRACIAILRTLLEGRDGAGFPGLELGQLLGQAYDGFAGVKLDLDRAATVAKVEEFAAERLRGLLASRTSSQVADAVLGGFTVVGKTEGPVVQRPTYALAKARALKAVVDRKEPWLERARQVSKRLQGISKEAAPLAPATAKLEGGAPAKVDADRTIVLLVSRLDEATAQLADEAQVAKALAGTEDAATKLESIFTDILVNDPNDPATPARLGVLSYGARCLLRIADFTRLG